MSAFDTLLQAIVSGLLMGAAYAFVSVGFTIVFGVMNIVNFAHGHIIMVAMFAAYVLFQAFGLDPYVAAPLLFVVFFGIGALFYRGVLDPIMEASPAAQLLITLGLLIALENGANMIFGGDLRSVSTPLAAGSVAIGPMVLPRARLLAAVISLALIAALWAALRFTRFGAEIRAAADDRLGALLIGIPIRRVFMRAVALATATAAVAGAIVLPFYLLSPFVGYDFMLKAFVISIIGGLGSLPGALIAGLLVGVIEAVSGLYLDSSLGTALVFSLLIVTLLIRPSGLFGRIRA